MNSHSFSAYFTDWFADVPALQEKIRAASGIWDGNFSLDKNHSLRRVFAMFCFLTTQAQAQG